jgi:septal ring factor EnvC (AmiA/AmiB activator)
MKFTVSEYAKRLNVSVQTVYKKVKRGVITTVKENNITYVIVDEDDGLNEVKQKVKESSNELLTLVKTQQKEIKRLTKKLEKCNQVKEDIFLQYIQEIKSLKQIQAPVEDKDDDIIEIEEEKKKSKKSKKKKKKQS